MNRERRLLQRHMQNQPKIEIGWDVIEAAGNEIMTEDVQKGRQVERGFVLAGSMIQNAQGETTAKVTRTLSLGTGTANAFDVTPDMARTITNHPMRENEKFLGFAHSHPEPFSAKPSRADLDYAQRLTNQKICMVLKVNADGGGNISVFNGDGYVDYTIVGHRGRQSFKAEENGVIDTSLLQGPAIPPAPEKIMAA